MCIAPLKYFLLILHSPTKQAMVGEVPRRSLSEMNIHDRDHLHALQHNNNINHTPTEGGEFYTAIGTDGINNATILL